MDVDYSKLKIIDLKNELRKLNLPLGGNKLDLINRLNNRVEKTSLENCNKFKKNPNINPVTRRIISSEGVVYKKYVKDCGEPNKTLEKTTTVKKPASPKPVKTAVKKIPLPKTVKNPTSIKKHNSPKPVIKQTLPKPVKTSVKKIPLPKPIKQTLPKTVKKTTSVKKIPLPKPVIKQNLPKTPSIKKQTLPKTLKKPASPKPVIKQTLKKNKTTKEEVYKFLADEYIKNTETNLQKPVKKEDDVLNLRVLKDKNVFYISSKENISGPQKQRTSAVDDTFGLRNFIQTNLMNVDNNNKATKPRYVKNRGWMYYKSSANKIRLARFQDAINKTNDKFRDYEIINEVAPKNKSFGIIGWDVPFDEPKWLIDITGNNWDRKYNPIVLENNTFLFNKCAISTKSAERAIEIIRKKSKNGIYPWKGIYPLYIGFPNGITKLKTFLTSSEYNTSFIGWSKHARFAYKEDNVLYIYDPWMQNINGTTFNQIKDIATSVGYNTIFVKRPPDQGAEGSCVNISLVRMILLSEFGKEGATMKIPYEYAILAQRLISKTR
jgi:hypothetical protein